MKLYAPDAILLGTVSPIIAEGTEPIRAYFARLPGSGNKVVIGERRTIVPGPLVLTLVLLVGAPWSAFAAELRLRESLLVARRDRVTATISAVVDHIGATAHPISMCGP